MHSQPTETNWNIFALTCSQSRLPGGCVCDSPSYSVSYSEDISAYSISVYIYKHNYTRGKTLQQLHPIPQQPLRGQRSSMHHGQDVSRKLLSHNGATSSETFVQIYKNLFELLPDIWGSRGERGHLAWLERCSTGNSSMSPTSVGHIRGSIFQQSLKLPTRSEGDVPGTEEMQKRARYASKWGIGNTKKTTKVTRTWGARDGEGCIEGIEFPAYLRTRRQRANHANGRTPSAGSSSSFICTMFSASLFYTIDKRKLWILLLLFVFCLLLCTSHFLLFPFCVECKAHQILTRWRHLVAKCGRTGERELRILVAGSKGWKT